MYWLSRWKEGDEIRGSEWLWKAQAQWDGVGWGSWKWLNRNEKLGEKSMSVILLHYVLLYPITDLQNFLYFFSRRREVDGSTALHSYCCRFPPSAVFDIILFPTAVGHGKKMFFLKHLSVKLCFVWNNNSEWWHKPCSEWIINFVSCIKKQWWINYSDFNMTARKNDWNLNQNVIENFICRLINEITHIKWNKSLYK